MTLFQWNNSNNDDGDGGGDGDDAEPPVVIFDWANAKPIQNVKCLMSMLTVVSDLGPWTDLTVDFSVDFLHIFTWENRFFPFLLSFMSNVVIGWVFLIFKLSLSWFRIGLTWGDHSDEMKNEHLRLGKKKTHHNQSAKAKNCTWFNEAWMKVLMELHEIWVSSRVTIGPDESSRVKFVSHCATTAAHSCLLILFCFKSFHGPVLVVDTLILFHIHTTVFSLLWIAI